MPFDLGRIEVLFLNVWGVDLEIPEKKILKVNYNKIINFIMNYIFYFEFS